MKFKSTLLAIFTGLFAMSAASAAVVYSENFNSYSTGNLTGQGSWTNSPAFFSSVATVGNATTGVNTTNAAARGTGISAAGAFAPVSLGLGSYTSGTFQMDVMKAPGTSTIYMAGFGVGSTSTAFSFGLSSNTFLFRQGVAEGTSLSLYSAPSTLITTTDSSWYRITANIDFTGSNSTITGVTVQNLTTAGSPFTAYFNSAANQTTLALASDETTWDRAYVRVGASTETGIGYVDNLQFTAVPEPTTWALLAASLTTVMVLRRRRRV